jgi:hypothetical protein
MGRPVAAIDPDLLRSLTETFTDEEIGKMLGFARVTVTGARKRHAIPSYHDRTGLKGRNGERYPGGRPRRIFFNERFFESVETEPQAYFLGLLAADGSVSSRGHCVEIMLGEPDQHILEEFCKALDGDSLAVDIRHVKNRSRMFHRLSLHSKAMADDLKAYGFTPKKTTDFLLTRELPPDMRCHFMRGFFDGDGSIGRDHFSVGIASKAFACQFALLVEEHGGELPNVSSKILPSGLPFYTVTIASNRFKAARDAIYGSGTLVFKRKRQSYLDFWC